jgi:hypothetical protein
MKEAAMHWRKTPSRAHKDKAFYFAIAAIGVSVALTSALLVLRYYA